MKSINVHTRHLNRQSYETITVMCQFCELNARCWEGRCRVARASRVLVSRLAETILKSPRTRDGWKAWPLLRIRCSANTRDASTTQNESADKTKNAGCRF